MYCVHEGKREILLWAYNKDQSLKRQSGSPGNEEPCKRSRYDVHVDKMIELEEIEGVLRGKHLDKGYSEEQLSAWAHLIQLKKHTSYDLAPSKPFWNIPSIKQKAATSESSSSSSVVPSNEVTISPGKRVSLRGNVFNNWGYFTSCLKREILIRINMKRCKRQ